MTNKKRLQMILEQAEKNDEWVILKTGGVVGYGTNVVETDAYMEYGKPPTLNDVRKVATLLNEADNQKDSDQ